MNSYDSNLTDSQWEIIEQLLDEQRKRKYSLRVIVDAILYMSKTGVQWRMLPKDFPAWQLVYYYFRKWSYHGLTEQIHDLLLNKVREKKGKKPSPSLGLVDSQSVKTASMTKEKGIDGNKKISGRKRFIVTDTLGLILAIFITPANTAERQGAQDVFKEMRGKYPRMVKILADQGFDGEAFVKKVMLTFGWMVEIVAKVAGVGGFQVLPKRWIVERTFGWLGFQRRLVKDYEQVVEHSTSFIHWAMIRLMVRKLA
jgi:putative transposase